MLRERIWRHQSGRSSVVTMMDLRRRKNMIRTIHIDVTSLDDPFISLYSNLQFFPNPQCQLGRSSNHSLFRRCQRRLFFDRAYPLDDVPLLGAIVLRRSFVMQTFRLFISDGWVELISDEVRTRFHWSADASPSRWKINVSWFFWPLTTDVRRKMTWLALLTNQRPHQTFKLSFGEYVRED